MSKERYVSFGGVTAALLASLCCIGPLVAVSLGVGSIAAFTIFEPYRPWLVAFATAMVAVAFWLAYRKREVRCEDGTCRHESGSRRTKLSVWSVAIVAALAIAFPYLGFAPQTSENLAIHSNAVATLEIQGMDCPPCATGLEGSIANMPGVRKAEVNFEAGKATVEYDGSLLKPTAFVERVRQNGYTATLIKVD